MVTPTSRTTISAAVFHVGSLARLQVSAYTRVDVTAERRFTSRVSILAVGQNLGQAAHAEFAGPASLLLNTQVPRSAGVRLRRTFR